MDISWSAILKVMLAGFATFVLLPAALIIRDMILWKLINFFILNDKLRMKIRDYALKAELYNEKYSGQHSFDESQIEKGLKFLTESQKAQDEIQDLKLLINRKSRFLNWLLVHYKQDYVNPINDWKKQAKEEIDNRKQSANKSIQPTANAAAD